MDFFVSDGAVFDAFGHDEHLAGVEGDGSVSELDVEAALEDEEEVVGVVVLVPDKFTFDFDDHDVGRIELGHGTWGPMVGKRS